VKPTLPPVPTIPQRSGNNAATFTALIMLLGVAAGLFFLVVMIAPFALGILVIGLLFVPTAIMHYFVWGNWLQEQHRREAEQEFREDS
jgi:membrane protein implicated in regulation of membrane protease activity